MQVGVGRVAKEPGQIRISMRRSQVALRPKIEHSFYQRRGLMGHSAGNNNSPQFFFRQADHPLDIIAGCRPCEISGTMATWQRPRWWGQRSPPLLCVNVDDNSRLLTKDAGLESETSIQSSCPSTRASGPEAAWLRGRGRAAEPLRRSRRHQSYGSSPVRRAD
jgi:hypothetical protein